MLKGRLKLLFHALMFVVIGFSFMGGDCSSDNNAEPPPKTVAAPGSVSLKVDANPGGGNSFATVLWTASQDENNSDFRGYRVITYVLNASNDIAYIFNEQSLPDTVHSYTVSPIDRNVKYKSSVLAELTDGTQSNSIETQVYGGVYYNNNGSIDSYTQTGNSLSGYGWDIQSGNGNQYLYIENNSVLIDLHLRETTGDLYFYSPDFFGANYKSSKIDLVGLGREAFEETELDEPDRTGYLVTAESVYLLKTEEGNYIKIWVKDIDEVDDQYFNVKFEYKVQPVAGLRIVKR